LTGPGAWSSGSPAFARWRHWSNSIATKPSASVGCRNRFLRPLRDAGLFSLWVPSNLDGAEVDVETSVRVVEELSRLDGAVGWNVMIAGNTSILWANLEHHAAAEMVAGDGSTVIAGTVTSGSGRAEPVSGGFSVSGRWPFASGCHQAGWRAHSHRRRGRHPRWTGDWWGDRVAAPALERCAS
jgi:alkylation response protein AidB-like acyl-CoA dehydrogenase